MMRMQRAILSIRLDRPAAEYVKVIGMGTMHRRGSVSFRARGNTLRLSAEADDAVALFASLGSAIKSMGVVASVGSLLGGKHGAGRIGQSRRSAVRA